MKIYSIICTRSKSLKPITKNLVDKLSSLPGKVMLMVNQESIFAGYKKAFDKINPSDKDIFILCHDDIELQQSSTDIVNAISIVNAEGYGFVGPAGTKLLGEDAVWWHQERWQQGFHSGHVHHLDKNSGSLYPTSYGPVSKVVVLDGLFLAASAKTLRIVGLEKPDYLVGDWDFYDLHYTLAAHEKGLDNVTVDLKIAHHSAGELVGREGWEENRLAFINAHKLPAQIGGISQERGSYRSR